MEQQFHVIRTSLSVILVLLLSSCVCGDERDAIKELRSAKRTLEGNLESVMHELEELRSRADRSGGFVSENRTLRAENEKLKELARRSENQTDTLQQQLSDLQSKMGRITKRYTALQQTYKARGDLPLDPGEKAIIHYWRKDGSYTSWGLHVWGPAALTLTTWEKPIEFLQQDDFGAYTVVNLHPEDSFNFPLKFFIHRGSEKDFALNRGFLAAENPEVWLIEGEIEIYTNLADANKAKQKAQNGATSP
jgi:regulator of replication initiation timing